MLIEQNDQIYEPYYTDNFYDYVKEVRKDKTNNTNTEMLLNNLLYFLNIPKSNCTLNLINQSLKFCLFLLNGKDDNIY